MERSTDHACQKVLELSQPRHRNDICDWLSFLRNKYEPYLAAHLCCTRANFLADARCSPSLPYVRTYVCRGRGHESLLKYQYSPNDVPCGNQ